MSMIPIATIETDSTISALGTLIRDRIRELDIRQSEFCRRYEFDQGLMSRLMTGSLKTVSLESALKLAIGLDVEPKIVFEAAGHSEWEGLIKRAYGTVR